MESLYGILNGSINFINLETKLISYEISFVYH